MSPIWMAAIFGTLGAIAAWSLVRAVTVGSIRSEGITFDADTNPIAYPATLAGRGLIVAFGVAEVAHAFGLTGDPFLTLKAWLGPLG
jgi:hypothetical protein